MGVQSTSVIIVLGTAAYVAAHARGLSCSTFGIRIKSVHRPWRPCPLSSHLGPDHSDNEASQSLCHSSRRSFLQSVALGGGWVLDPNIGRIIMGHSATTIAALTAVTPTVNAAPPDDSSVVAFVTGTVIIPKDFDFAAAQAKTTPIMDSSTGETIATVPALYVTVRPDKPDNVPQAILQGTRGKPPPVLTARYEQPTFPFTFCLTTKDYTYEGKPQTPEQQPWWLTDDLIVSARLDMDGIAATRSPEDLVGRTICYSGGKELVELALSDRGAFGKFATKKK